jgi:hypothetical protein
LAHYRSSSFPCDSDTKLLRYLDIKYILRSHVITAQLLISKGGNYRMSGVMKSLLVSFLGLSVLCCGEAFAGKTAAKTAVAPQQNNGTINACSLFTEADIAKLVGNGASKQPGNRVTECDIAAPGNKHLIVSVTFIGDQREAAKKGALMALKKPTPIAGLGDEAFSDASGLSVVAIKGKQLVMVTGAGFQAGVQATREINIKLARKAVEQL